MKELPPRLINPPPKRCAWGDGLVRLPANAHLRIPDEGLSEPDLSVCLELWESYTLGCGTLTVERGAGAFEFSLIPGKGMNPPEVQPLQHPETYGLVAGAGGISVRAAGRSAWMQAWMTLLQLLHPYELTPGEEVFTCPKVCISDWPAMNFRGLHLCVFPETDLLHLERMIRVAGLMKYSHVVLEFWGSLRLESYPLLGWPHLYGPDDIRPLIETGRELGLEMVPMFNIWGHASGSRALFGRHVVLDQDPSQAMLFEPGGWTWCLSHPDILELHLNICRELCDLFGPGEYFHLGCDEAFSHARCDRCRGKDSRSLLVKHVNALAEELLAAGRRPMIWGDALLDASRWSHPVIATSRPDQQTHLALSELNRKLLICDWQYFLKEDEVPTPSYFEEQGFEVILCPWQDLENIRCLARAAGKQQTYGFMQTTWHTLAEHQEMISAGAAGAWVGDHEEIYPGPGFEGPGYLSDLGQHYRTLVPGDGGYDQSGWNEGELANKGF